MKFDKYSTYSVDAFLEDPEFRNWANHPTTESNRFWQDFLEQYPGQKAPLDQARYILQEMNEYFAASDQPLNPSDSKFQKVLLQTMEKAKADKKAQLRRRKTVRRLALAASVALILAAFSWFWLSADDELQTIATSFGEWRTEELPDGSMVNLNANSEIRLAKNWSKGADRRVWLQGEAFFQVKKKPQTNAKFQVITDDLTVEVYGTSFNVHSRGEQTSVFLEEGKIKLDLGQKEEFLNPGDFIAYSAKEKRFTQRQQKVTAEKHTSWKDGTHSWPNTPAGEILDEIEEIYGVDIIEENPEIRDQKITVRVPNDKKEMAIPILKKTLETSGFIVEIIDNQLIVK